MSLYDSPQTVNVIAELPGTDLRNEIVLIGGHFDSHHGGTGATDNATGVAGILALALGSSTYLAILNPYTLVANSGITDAFTPLVEL